jgi:serine/threonine protein phosphatase PrpC
VFHRASTGPRFFSSEVSQLKFNIFNSGIYLNPHFEKRKKGGEDAASLADNMLAVADGVGGWITSGVDPAIFARKLCRNIDGLYADKSEHYI